MSRNIRGVVCPHDTTKLFVYHGTEAKEAWWCSICDKDLYEEAGRPRTLEHSDPTQTL